MLFSQWFPFRRKSPQPTPDWQEGLHTVERFTDILQCERMRADRSGIRFCTVVFSLDPSDSQRCHEFMQHVKSRMRATDHMGMMGDTQVGIILWDTLEPGARSYLKTILDHDSASCVHASRIYLYPTPNTPAGPDQPNQAERTLSKSSANESDQAIVEPLDVLFIQKLPLWKRTIDIAGATVGLIALSPLLVATALLIKLTSRGPILFKQERDGLGGKRFTIYKFRTMRVDAERLKDELRKFSEQDGPAFKLTNDPRITKIGSYLRKTCIDELPQLWNVLKGDMTLVGPRPLDSKEAEKITGWGRRRLEVTPGLTCIWQVHGKSKVTFNEWMRMDIRYMKQRKPGNDIRLIWETIVSIVRHRASV